MVQMHPRAAHRFLGALKSTSAPQQSLEGVWSLSYLGLQVSFLTWTETVVSSVLMIRDSLAQTSPLGK